MQHWWVNQNKTYSFEVHGGYMWSPKTNSNGARNQFYENMTGTNPGDVVFSFKDTYIKAVGIVTGFAETSIKPLDFNSVENPWSEEGWLVPVEFTALEKPIRPKDHMDLIGPTLPEKYSPIQHNGNGLQVYLASVPTNMAHVLSALLDGQVEAILGTGIEEEVLRDAEEDRHEAELRSSDITETEKFQVSKARLGMGLFKTRVRQIEKRCRVTGVSGIKHLTASHIKPWRFSNSFEKLDGNNGLLLSPHVDHLFDRGYISFTANGSLLVSHQITGGILAAWNIDPHLNVGSFLPGQETYLQFHRDNVFKR